MALEVGRRLDHVVRADHPADAPPGHRVGLGDTVDDDALVGEVGHERRHRRELVRTVREVLVDLVGDHPDPVLDRPLADRFDGGRRIHRTRRVVGADEQQDLRARCTRRVELLDRDLEAALGVGVDHDRDAAGQRDRLRIRRPVRRGADDLVARIAQRGERRVHRVLAAVGDEHLRRRCSRTPSRAWSWRRSPPSAPGSPPAGVYRWLRTSEHAAIAASTMCCGVGKSGSPAPNPITFSPSACRALALASTARVADGAIAASRAEVRFTIGKPATAITRSQRGSCERTSRVRHP